jgi:hypothetical protein
MIFDQSQTTALGYGAMRMLRRRWFASLPDPPADRFLTLLLLDVYCSFIAGVPLNKKSAWTAMGVEDIKTGRKYITRAQELGLIAVHRSDKDKRKELLCPTDYLKLLIEVELNQFASEIDSMQKKLQDAEREKPRMVEGELKNFDQPAFVPSANSEAQPKDAWKKPRGDA